MSSNRTESGAGEVRVELKYCEHCGGLWVREGGAGVYCAKCQARVAELPEVKKKPGRVSLPVGRRTVVEEYEVESSAENARSRKAAGGAA